MHLWVNTIMKQQFEMKKSRPRSLISDRRPSSRHITMYNGQYSNEEMYMVNKGILEEEEKKVRIK